MSPNEERRRTPSGEVDWRETLFTMMGEVEEQGKENASAIQQLVSAINFGMPQTDGSPDMYKHRNQHDFIASLQNTEKKDKEIHNEVVTGIRSRIRNKLVDLSTTAVLFVILMLLFGGGKESYMRMAIDAILKAGG